MQIYEFSTTCERKSLVESGEIVLNLPVMRKLGFKERFSRHKHKKTYKYIDTNDYN